MRLIGFALLLLLLGSACPGLALSSIRAKCSACRAVADMLVGRLEAEVPRNHLDMRHRVGPDGKRWGKVIAYQMSELRVIELLDDLCDEMNVYELAPGGEADGGRPQRWVLSDTRIGKPDRPTQKLKQERKELTNYCADLLERHEDELSEGLRQGAMDSHTSSDFLCLATAKHCEQTLAEEEQQEEAYAAAEAAAEAAEAKAAEAAAAEAAENDAQQEPEASAAAETEAESDTPQQVEL